VRWGEAKPLVEVLLAEFDVVVTMAELETLYFWERYDILFSPSRLGEIPSAGEFASDHRTGRPVISTRDSLARLVDCTASGLFIATAYRWRQPQFIDRETAAFIEQTMTRVHLPANMHLLVFSWAHTPPAEGVPACDSLHELLERTGR
jgi:hypothetical protein